MELIESSTRNYKVSDTTSEGIDRLSTLPDDLLHKIFSSLYIFDVVQLSLLSKRWKYIWTTMPFLHFDIDRFCEERIGGRLCYVINTEKFKDFINWVLISQRETKLVSFFLRGSFDKVDILRWIHAATRRNVQQLVLEFQCDEPELFELPFCLATCESLQVLKLNLSGSILKLPNHFGFRQLKLLHLEDFKLSDEHFTSCFFSKCPVLESLILYDCCLEAMTLLDITSTSLVYVTIRLDVYVQLDSYNNCKFKISCPNLKLLGYETQMPKDIIIENLFSIEDVRIIFNNNHSLEDTGIFVHKMIKEVSSTSVLTLSEDSILGMYEATSKERLPPVSFYKLKTLKLYARVDEDFMQAMILLLKYSPNLEVLQLWSQENHCWTKSGQMHDPDESIVCLESHLKSIRLSNFKGEENEIELLRFFLKNAEVLEKLMIFWAKNAFWEEYFLKSLVVSLKEDESAYLAVYADKTKEISEKVLKLPKTSSRVILTFLDAKPEPSSCNWYDRYSK